MFGPEAFVSPQPGHRLFQRRRCEAADDGAAGFGARDQGRVRQHVEMLHDRWQRHGKRTRQVADGCTFPLAQLGDQRAPGRIGERRENVIQLGVLILNHVVNNIARAKPCQASVVLAPRSRLIRRKLYILLEFVHYPEIASMFKVSRMEIEDQYRDFVLSTLVSDIPELFWRRFGERAQFVYGEAFSSVTSDAALLLEQKAQKLYQERYFKMEHALVAAARETAVPASAKLIGTNLCHYALVGRDRVEFTQSYVKASGDMPTPAAFRKQLAEMAEFKRAPRLNLGDVPSDLIEPKRVSGIVLHSPAGRKFAADDQKLGAIGFFVAYDDFKGWAVELTLSEIISAYLPVEKREDRAAPTRKKIGKTGTEE